ncbi:MAG: bifunctional hexulose-6-phosphate synthase/ribonuclease regulator [Candidatus Hecatellales archaeon]|nr:MAG: bifunctional hexulose-6-phosphate synthase/ribonuclease regulator [Candidatus Hecatellales archaeon]
MSEKPKLQVALDFVNLHRALKVAEEAVKGGVDWIEVGTPLIKSEGLNAVREIKKIFPNHTVLADMKTVDTGSIEVEMAAKAGADIVIILGVSDDSTVKEAVEAGRRYGAKIMVDLLGVEDPYSRSIELEKLGVDYICVHVGIDQQMRGVDPLKLLKQVVEAVRIPVAVAGGINSETAAEAVKAGAAIVIVGGAITKAENAEEAAKTIKKAMETKAPIKTALYKKYGEGELYKVFMEVSTPNISDAMHRKGEMVGIKPITNGVKAVGKALTVRTYPGDWAKPVESVDLAEPGTVIVVDAGGGSKAIWGELATWSCVQKGVSGVVIDGAVRDVDVIRDLKFPVFARTINPTAGDPKGFGEINVEIVCGGVRVRPGDWIVADDNGVVVIPRENAVEIANRAKDVFEKEQRIRAEIKRGSTLSKVLKLKKWEKIVG